MLRKLLWEPPTAWTQELVWQYFSSRPRRYHLEPQLLRVVSARYSSRYDRLEVRVMLGAKAKVKLEVQAKPKKVPKPKESKPKRNEEPKPEPEAEPEFECWLSYDDVILNPMHALVVAAYQALYDPRPRIDTGRKHVPHQVDVEYPARILKPKRTKSTTSLASSVPSTS